VKVGDLVQCWPENDGPIGLIVGFRDHERGCMIFLAGYDEIVPFWAERLKVINESR
jgi:hypothetical protein